MIKEGSRDGNVHRNGGIKDSPQIEGKERERNKERRSGDEEGWRGERVDEQRGMEVKEEEKWR